MKPLFCIIATVLLATGSSYSQPVANIFSSADFGEQIKKPEKLEIVKDVFQGVWAINVYSPEGKVVDTVIVKLQNYSTKHRDVIYFSSAKADSLSDVIDPTRVTFFQSKEKSTIRFALAETTLNFDGVLRDDLSISASTTSNPDGLGEYRIEATKVANDWETTFICGNDAPHARHIGKKPDLLSLQEAHGCTNWSPYKEPRE